MVFIDISQRYSSILDVILEKDEEAHVYPLRQRVAHECDETETRHDCMNLLRWKPPIRAAKRDVWLIRSTSAALRYGSEKVLANVTQRACIASCRIHVCHRDIALRCASEVGDRTVGTVNVHSKWTTTPTLSLRSVF